jgi:CRP-like cAMP-binding protein
MKTGARDPAKPGGVIPIQADSAWRGIADCRNCATHAQGLFANLSESDFDLIHAPIDALAHSASSVLYAQGSAAQGVFCVHSGMLKLVRFSADGRQRIVRVLRVGDVAGLEALSTARYDSQAVALGAVSVCRIPLSVVHALAENSPRLHLTLMGKWQQQLREADDWLAELNFGTARQRVCSLVLKMRGVADPQIVSLFSREDMGAMLDLKLETVSREISALVREQVLEQLDKQGRSYRLLQPDLLQAN